MVVVCTKNKDQIHEHKFQTKQEPLSLPKSITNPNKQEPNHNEFSKEKENTNKPKSNKQESS